MYLKHLTISGFKSFAKKSELEFNTPITAIVGPNGSGKSNVAESFRFVLGEQSIKSMRGKKGEDLIWGGSDSISRGNRASVQVVLDNRERVFSVDYDEIVLERTVYRDGQNEYEVNGSKVRLKDVQELLAAANIGSTGHHIISQGEADRILSAGPKERREMIEDALGLKVYQYKKTEAEKKLKKTEENIAQAESLRREVAPHLKYLGKQMKKIERALELRSELTTTYAEYLKREDIYLAHHYDRLITQRREPSKKLEKLKAEIITAKAVLSADENSTENPKRVELEEKIDAARQQKHDLLRHSGQLEGQVSFLERRIRETEQQARSESEAPVPIGEVKELLAVIESSISKSLASNDVSFLQRTLNDVLHITRKFIQNVKGKVNSDVSKEEKELDEIKRKLKKVEEDIERIKLEEDKYNAEYEALKKTLEAELQESHAAERRIFQLVGEEHECENKLLQIDQEIRIIERDRDEFKRELSEAVVLIGSGAASYLRFDVIEKGQLVSKESIVNESRDIQYKRRHELEKMKIRLEELGGGNEDVEKEYKNVKERDEFLEREIEDLNTSVLKLNQLINELNEQLNERFISGIDKIGVEFSRFFTLMFGGGEAKLIRIKPKIKKQKKGFDEDGEEIDIDEEVEDEFAQEGIELDVKLPNKRVRGLDMLSGGERALTSIALIFAMSQVNPPLFIILDETDAALDEANSRRYGDMIQALAEKSQLILITHNRETMSRAGVLYGVTMGGDGVSKLLSVKFDEALAVAK